MRTVSCSQKIAFLIRDFNLTDSKFTSHALQLLITQYRSMVKKCMGNGSAK